MSLQLLQRLFGGQLRPTEGPQGLRAWTWRRAAKGGEFQRLRHFLFKEDFSWGYVAGLFDAVACIRVGRQTLIEVPHKSLTFLERLQDFLATVNKSDGSDIFVRDFHRRNRLIVKSPLSEAILSKLLCRLRVRRVAVALILKPRPPRLISLKELRGFASLQQASLSQNAAGELRLVPLFQSTKRTLEFQNRAKEAEEMRRHLEMHLQRAKRCFKKLSEA